MECSAEAAQAAYRAYQSRDTGLSGASIYLVTTLTDADIYTKDELANSTSGAGQWSCSFAKSRRPWEWKSSCRTPEMARKELRMHLIAYNLIRGLMQEVATQESTRLERVSFKGVVDTVPHFSNALNAIEGKAA